METPTELTTTTPEQFIEQGLKRFDELEITQESLIQLRDSVKDLTIIDANDKEGFKAVQEGRKLLKKRRNFIEKVADNTRDLAKRFNKAIIEREKEYVSIITPTEKALEEKETWYYDERERIRLEEEKKESDRIQSMIDQLHDYNYAVDFHELKALTEEQFQTVLADAKAKYEENARLMEEERQKEEEQLRLEAERKQQEEAELKRQREEQVERERIFNDKQAEIHAENERIRKEQEAKEKELRDRQAELDRQERERIEKAKQEEDRKKAEIEATKKARHEVLLSYGHTYPFMDLGTMPQHQYELLEAKHREIYQEKLKEKARLELEEAERLKKEKLEELLKFGEDTDRFANYAQQLELHWINSPTSTYMKSKKGKEVSLEVDSLIRKAWELCKENMEPNENRKAIFELTGQSTQK